MWLMSARKRNGTDDFEFCRFCRLSLLAIFASIVVEIFELGLTTCCSTDVAFWLALIDVGQG